MKTIKATITGSVQGVFFRGYIKEQADKLGLKGYVRNLENGEVEVVIEGRDELTNEMLLICKKGAPHSQVKAITSQEIPNQSFKDFRVINV